MSEPPTFIKCRCGANEVMPHRRKTPLIHATWLVSLWPIRFARCTTCWHRRVLISWRSVPVRLLLWLCLVEMLLVFTQPAERPEVGDPHQVVETLEKGRSPWEAQDAAIYALQSVQEFQLFNGVSPGISREVGQFEFHRLPGQNDPDFFDPPEPLPENSERLWGFPPSESLKPLSVLYNR